VGATVRVGSGQRWLTRAVGPGHKLAVLLVLAAVLALGALACVAWAAGFGSVAHVLIHPRWGWIAAALGGELVAYAGYTFAYGEIARAEDGAELDTPKAAALVATGFAAFLQGGGFALDREALRRVGLSKRQARERVLALAMVEYAVLAPATAVAALLVLLRVKGLGASMTLPWIVGVPAGATIALVALRFRRRIERSNGWRAALGHALSALGFVLGLARSRSAVAYAGIAVYWLGDVFCLWATLHVFAAQPPPVAQLLVGYASGYALTRRALPLGGAGVVEVLLPFALGWVGIALPQALLAVVLYRAINLWLPMIPALVSIPALARLEAGGRRRAA
jgi:putative heme transporter